MRPMIAHVFYLDKLALASKALLPRAATHIRQRCQRDFLQVEPSGLFWYNSHRFYDSPPSRLSSSAKALGPNQP